MKQLQLLMGMPITVEVVDSRVTEADIEKIFAYFRSVDDTFSTYKVDSEISKVNRGELREEEYSDDMKTILALSEQTREETLGYFDILHDDIIDPSGIVKGWAILQASRMLKEAGFSNFYIDAGGDIQVSGKKDGNPWRIGIRNPFNRKENVKVLALHNKHIFNPAAIAVVITSFALGESASWWVGTASMLPAVLVGGALLVRKLRQGEMVLFFVATALITVCLVSVLQGLSVTKELQQLLVESPLFFFAAIMLTEPLTVPPTQNLKCFYAIIVGILFVPQMHFGRIYSTPELALVTGNVYSYLVSPKRKFVLKLKRKSKIASNTVDFTFKPSPKLVFAPGQYMEFTLAHAKPDSRGNRRMLAQLQGSLCA